MLKNRAMPRKWIAKRITALDPDTDYDEIWKLSSAYRPNDFMMNLVYAVTFPHFFVREHDAIPLFDEGKGKILADPHKRSDDTSWKMQVWWHYGSHHQKTASNVESINRLHAHYAETYPDSFKHNDSYLYTLCYEAAGMHRLMLRIGLPGYTENEKRAAVMYWARMGTLFRNVGTGGEITGFPDTFDGIMEYMDRYEAEDVAQHAMGPGNARAIIQQFADRYFPKPLHPLVRAWVISLYPDHLVKAYNLKKPRPLVVKALRAGTAAFFVLGEKVLPDPTDTFTERRKAATAKKRDHSGASVSATSSTTMAAAAAAGCPHARMHTQNQAAGKDA